MIEKLDPRDTRLVVIIDKLNETIKVVNELYETVEEPMTTQLDSENDA